MEDLTPEDAKKVREIGVEVLEVNDRGDSFQVIVEIPDKNQTHRGFNFSKKKGDWNENVVWVEDGQEREMKRWKKHIKDKIDRSLESVEDDQTLDASEGERIEL